MTDPVNHPSHYGGANNPYEAIKVIEAWELGFNLGNAVKYISRAGKKAKRNKAQAKREDLEKAMWYLKREIENIKDLDDRCPSCNMPRTLEHKSNCTLFGGPQ